LPATELTIYDSVMIWRPSFGEVCKWKSFERFELKGWNSIVPQCDKLLTDRRFMKCEAPKSVSTPLLQPSDLTQSCYIGYWFKAWSKRCTEARAYFQYRMKRYSLSFSTHPFDKMSTRFLSPVILPIRHWQLRRIRNPDQWESLLPNPPLLTRRSTSQSFSFESKFAYYSFSISDVFLAFLRRKLFSCIRISVDICWSPAL